MVSNNPYNSENLDLERSKVRIFILFFIISAIYSIIVLLIIISPNFSNSVKLYVILSYAIIAPISFYMIWLLFYNWKAKKIPQNEEIFGSKNQYLILFFLLGVCVITWSAYWNTGIFSIWMLVAAIYYAFTGDELGAVVIFVVGAYAITPALVEEFNKSLPSILAFFVVLQRSNNTDQKNKGMLGNELNGFLIGILIGLAFESIETAGYIVITILSGGNALDIYLQATLRNWGPIHILGGALGGYAAGRAERLRFELKEEYLPMRLQIKMFIKRFVPIWLIPVSLHFLWNSMGVWIFFIFLALNNSDEGLYILTIIMCQLILACISYVFLWIFYKRANEIAQKTHRCSITGMIISHKDVVCSDFSEIKEEHIPTEQNYCTNCGAEKTPLNKFCTQCGFSFEQSLYKSKSVRLYEKFTMKLFIISIIIGIIFIIYTLSLFVILLLILGSIAWYLFFTQSIFEIISIIMFLYATITLLKLKKNYNGRKSMWSWLFLVYNIIGMTGAFIFMSIYIILNLGLLVIIGEVEAIFLLILLIIVLILITMALLNIIFLKKVLSKEQQVLHYQRWY